jgi:hypothetical protein
MDNNITEVWKRYEAGRSFNQSLSPDLYSLVSTNTEFFAGNQWLNMPETPAMARLPKPVFNIIKRVASLFVASLTSSACSISFEPLRNGGGGFKKSMGENYTEGSDTSPEKTAADFATAEVSNLLEKFKMDYRIREALFDGAVSGDYCAHFWFDAEAQPYGSDKGSVKGEIRMELVDGVNVMFGNPASADVESQPYILVIGEDSVDNLRAEAEKYRSGPESGDIGEITGESDYDMPYRHGSTDSGRCRYIYMYRKGTSYAPELTSSGLELVRKTTVFVTKATKSCLIYEDVNTGLSRYPLAWGVWEKQKNNYHGRALVTGIIPNQIFINTMFAMVMRHLQLSGFPKTVYNASLIPRWNNEIGQAIGVNNLAPGQPITSAASVLAPADMSGQIIAAIDKAMEYTKECLGATDAQLGNVKPENTSAIMVLQSAAQVPLENVRSGLYEWVEDIGAILLDMMGTYYGRRSVVRTRELAVPDCGAGGEPVINAENGLMRLKTEKRRVCESYDFSVFKNLWLGCRADVGASTYYSEIASVQSLDNLRREGLIDAVQYLERVPDRLIPRRAELIAELKSRLRETSVIPCAHRTQDGYDMQIKQYG